MSEYLNFSFSLQGHVTNGRVNGNLNLSRALGDLQYKRNKDLTPGEQVISGVPDLKTETLSAQDRFLVIACDGIWNSMTSQQVVDFVNERLDSGLKADKICEEILDHCLAPTKDGDGNGCDNMTVVIVLLNSVPTASSS